MLRWGFRLQLAGLIGSLLFILAILAAYAYVGLYYLEGQGPSAHRRELARVATQLSDRWARRAGPWLAERRPGGAGERFPFAVPPRPPAGIRRIRDLSVWALPATIAAALLGMSLALWTAVNLQRSITTMQAGLELGREMVASLMQPPGDGRTPLRRHRTPLPQATRAR
jgi:hypothetical protein